MSIHKKLLQFQQQGITLVKDGTNPHFHSSYATLNEVLDKVKEPLNKLGVLIVQESIATGLRTKLVDTEDDSFVESIMPYTETSTAQKLGSNLTYLRRYALVALLGLGDSDDDGNLASTPRPTYKAPQASPSHERPNVDIRVPIINEDGQEDPMVLVCACGLQKKRIQTKKPGPNQGRYFYSCPKPMNQQCPNSFQWEDDGDGKNGPSDNVEGTREADFLNGAYIGGHDANESNNDPR